jgi:hypothetical protein
MNPPIAIKRRERDAVLQSLQAGLVPKQGLHLIQVGRKAEVSALLQDLDRVCDEGASFRIVVVLAAGRAFFLILFATWPSRRNSSSLKLTSAWSDGCMPAADKHARSTAS